ncbi:aconitase X swivel domain-containing protein [Marinobacterium jannaschii]|uniref:aconitase X swivel domain-containing protein n=1 Tax=Marinobacterium jannaschii TaxID=64970 RepID=UPI000487A5DC|nr:DUF126 domain-containing protein [Marinobacterium jannaschii]
MNKLKSSKPGLGAAVEGKALVLKCAFSARYDLDVKTGKFLRPGLATEDACVAGKILIADRAKGGVASSWLLREMVRLGTAPAALVFNNAGPVMVQAAAFAGISLLDGFEEDVTEVLTQDQQLWLDPANREIVAE